MNNQPMKTILRGDLFQQSKRPISPSATLSPITSSDSTLPASAHTSGFASASESKFPLAGKIKLHLEGKMGLGGQLPQIQEQPQANIILPENESLAGKMKLHLSGKMGLGGQLPQIQEQPQANIVPPENESLPGKIKLHLSGKMGLGGQLPQIQEQPQANIVPPENESLAGKIKLHLEGKMGLGTQFPQSEVQAQSQAPSESKSKIQTQPQPQPQLKTHITGQIQTQKQLQPQPQIQTQQSQVQNPPQNQAKIQTHNISPVPPASVTVTGNEILLQGKINLGAPTQPQIVFNPLDAHLKNKKYFEPMISQVSDQDSRYIRSVYAEDRLYADGRPIQIVAAVKHPHIVLLQDFVSAAECEAIIEAAKPGLQPSSVVGRENQVGTISQRRTSEGTYLTDRSWPLLNDIERRIAAVTNTSVAQGEMINVLCYRPGQESKQHFDYFMPQRPSTPEYTQLKSGGQRIATFIIYLNTVAQGGETEFNLMGLKVSAIRGQALFFSYTENGQHDMRSLHAGLPPTLGEKWVAVKFIRQTDITDQQIVGYG